MPALTDQEIQRNMQYVDNAIAEQEMEGLTVSPETEAELRRVARGEMTTEEVTRNILRRLQHDQANGK